MEHEIAPGVEFRLQVTEDADLRVQAYDTSDGRHAIYSAVHSRDFYTKRQTRSTIRNDIVDQLPDGFDKEAADSALRDLFAQMDSKSDEVKKKLRPPDVARVLNNTEAVKVFAGEDAQFLVDVSINGRPTTFEFTAGEWANDSPAPLKTQFANSFYEVLELDADQWREIRKAWQEDLEEVGRESQTTDQIVAAQVLNTVSKHVKPVDEKEKLLNDKYTAFYDEDGEIADDQVPEGETVLWVRSQAIIDALDGTSKSEEYTNRLSRALKEANHIYSGSRRHRVSGSRKYLYPFDPEALDIGYMDVHTDDDGDEEVEP